VPQASRPLKVDGPAAGGAALMRMPVAHLKLGMFVADLDRPWSETPFLLEGLLLEDEREIALITELCREVRVDLSRSVCADMPPPQAAQAAPSAAHLEAASAWNDMSSDRISRAARPSPQRRPEPDIPDWHAPTVEDSPVIRRPFAWLRTVCRQMLESYLRQDSPAPSTLPAGDTARPTRRARMGGGPAGMPALLARMLRELLSPGRAREAATAAAAPEASMPQVMNHAPDLAAGSRAGVWQMLVELFTRRRRDEPEVSDFFARDDPSRLRRAPAAGARRHRKAGRALPLRVLLWRVILKMLGIRSRQAEDPPAWSQFTTIETAIGDGGDLTAAERAEAEQQVQRFERDLPRVAVRLRQGIRAMHATYRQAALGLPLPMELLDPVVTQIVDDVLRNEDATLWLARLQSHDQSAHARGLQAAIYMAHLGSRLGLPREHIEPLALAGALLDIGKMRVPSAILKKPGPLDAEETRQVRLHVAAALQLLDVSGGVDERVRQAVGRHHEREDGSGYPARMRGDDIGLYGRIAGIVDTFLALSSMRSHAPPQPIDDCMRVLLKGCGSLFHAPLVEQFIQMVGVYPVGSLVELSTGEIAAVLSHNRVRRLRPRVLLVVGADGLPLSRPAPLDLLYRPKDPAGDEIRIVRGLPVGSHGIRAADLFMATVPQ